MTSSLEDWVLAQARPPRLDILEQAQIPGARLDYSNLESRDAFSLLSQACALKFGDFEALRFQTKVTYGPRAHSATLTVTRPDDIGIEFSSSGGHAESTQAKAHAALRAVQEGALRFILEDKDAPVGRDGLATLPEPARQRRGKRSKQTFAARSYYKNKNRNKGARNKNDPKNTAGRSASKAHLSAAVHPVNEISSSVAQLKSPETRPIKKQKTNHAAPIGDANAQAIATDTQSPEVQITRDPGDRHILIEVHAPAGSAQPTITQQRGLGPSGSVWYKIIVQINE